MAISNYSELKAAVVRWMDREDLTDEVGDFITLAEARLNRELEASYAEATLTGVAGSNRIDVTALSIVEATGLFLKDGQGEREISQMPDGTFTQTGNAGEPSRYALEADHLSFDCPLDAPYPFRFEYRTRFALSDAAPTNQLLTDHPDVYLAAVITWGGLRIRADQDVSIYAQALQTFMDSTKHHLAQRRRSEAKPDKAIVAMLQGRNW